MELKEATYKQTETGLIPEDWILVPFATIGKPFGGLTGKTKNDFGHGSGLYVTFLNVIQNTVIDSSLLEPVVINQGENQHKLRKGDLLFNTSSETPEEIGMCALLDEDLPNLYLNSFCFGCRLKEDSHVDGLYISYIVNSSIGRQLFLSSAQGATRYNLSKKNFLKISIPLPPTLEEQRAIATALSDVDSLITSLDKLIAKKKAIKQGAMQRLLTPPAQGGQRLPGYEGKWVEVEMQEITSLMTNGFVGIAKTQYTESDDGILYIQGYNVSLNSFNMTGIKRVSHEFHKRNSKSCLMEGDLLTVQTGDVGLTTIIPKELEGSNCHALIISRFKKGKADPWFYSQYFNSQIGRAKLGELETGTTMKHINVGDLKSWKVPFLTDLKEQIAISRILWDMDKEIESLESKKSKYLRIKQGMMQELLTGKTRLV